MPAALTRDAVRSAIRSSSIRTRAGSSVSLPNVSDEPMLPLLCGRDHPTGVAAPREVGEQRPLMGAERALKGRLRHVREVGHRP